MNSYLTAMNISNARATFGLNCKATPANDNISGTVQIGDNVETATLSDALTFITFDAVMVGSGSDLVIDVSDLDSTGSTAWTSGVAQVETATAAGTITGDGDAAVVVTATGMTGTPKTINVAVLNGDTAATWAGKVRTALAADADVSAMFTVGGTTTSIVLTRKPLATYTIKGVSVPVYPANIAVNISLDNGTCTGITTAATSANTTGGIATVGAYAPELDGNDFEGNATGGSAGNYCILIKNSASSGDDILLSQSTVLVGKPVTVGGCYLIYDPSGSEFEDITIEPASNTHIGVTVTIASA